MIDDPWGFSTFPLVPGHKVVGTHRLGWAAGETPTNGPAGWLGLAVGELHVLLSTPVGRTQSSPAARAHHRAWTRRFRRSGPLRLDLALPLPKTLTFETSGPQFCAGITVFNAMVQFGVKPSDRVGVIGIGGKGHLALQFLNTWAATCMRSVQATGEFRMTARHFIVQKATTFDVASDGTSFRMNFICRDGSRVSLSLPTECLHGFMMTLPQMMRQALRTRGDNESLGLVYPVDNLRIKHSSEPNVFIVTLTMMNGFEASYGLTRQQMMDFDVTDAVERE
jgi:hypothetical protein